MQGFNNFYLIFEQLSAIALSQRTTKKTLSFTDKAYHYLRVSDTD